MDNNHPAITISLVIFGVILGFIYYFLVSRSSAAQITRSLDKADRKVVIRSLKNGTLPRDYKLVSLVKKYSRVRLEEIEKSKFYYTFSMLVYLALFLLKGWEAVDKITQTKTNPVLDIILAFIWLLLLVLQPFINYREKKHLNKILNSHS